MFRMQRETVDIAIVGCGTVGGATAETILTNRALIAEKSGLSIRIKYIVDRHFKYAKHLQLDETLFEQDFERVLEDEEVHTVVETVGGVSTAKDIIESALRAGKHVVTANKALLAQHGAELFGLAREQGRTIGFEASCAGGIPILRAIYDGHVANRIDALYSIVNGTSNYILTRMNEGGVSFEDALQEAKFRGLAERDPSLDVNGTDSAHKIALLASLSFGVWFDFDEIPVEGIDTLESIDVASGARLGYVVKLLAIAEHELPEDEESRDGAGTQAGDTRAAGSGELDTAGRVSIRVRPAFISNDHPLAWVNGPFNAVSVYGSATGHTMYYGRGAGGAPTASAVIADIVATANGTLSEVFRRYGYWPDTGRRVSPTPLDELESRFYLRVMADDSPGTLAAIAEILARHGANIASVHQEEDIEDALSDHHVPVVITLDRTLEGNVRRAKEEIDALTSSSGACVSIPIVDEHPESVG
jgi:homoserine dehydrogenase